LIMVQAATWRAGLRKRPESRPASGVASAPGVGEFFVAMAMECFTSKGKDHANIVLTYHFQIMTFQVLSKQTVVVQPPKSGAGKQKELGPPDSQLLQEVDGNRAVRWIVTRIGPILLLRKVPRLAAVQL